MHQPCSNVLTAGGKLDIHRHREEIRRLVAEAPDEPTHCEFKEQLSYATKKDKGELVKDVSSFANADLEVLGGNGYIVFGVSNDGRVIGIGNILGDPPSEIRQIVNGHLDRPVIFEYVTCEVDDKAGGKKRVAAIIVPDSRRRPHVASREIKERLKNRDTFWLRKGEVWVRKTGGRELATAEDIDAMYEGKLRRLVDDQVRPLQERIGRLEREVRERMSAAPELGFAVTKSSTPSQEIQPYPVLGNLIEADQVEKNIESAKERAANVTETDPLASRLTGIVVPTAEDYEEYAQSLQEWFGEVQDLCFVDFVFSNTGGAPAEDVQVVLMMAAKLRPTITLPTRPARPSIILKDSGGLAPWVPPVGPSIQPRPDRIIGPRICSRDASGRAVAVWEVPKLYHDRPLFTRSKVDHIGRRNGLLISGKGLRELQAQAGEEWDLTTRYAQLTCPRQCVGSWF